jgi:hypothetical protein
VISRHGHVLGIDFGTSTTVAVLGGPDGRSRPLLFDASPLLPSGVFVGADAVLLTGVDAERAALGSPSGYEANPKRRIDEGTVWLGERELPVVDLVAAVLGRVADEARRVVGVPPARVVITHPARWGPARRRVLADAARRAGLGEVELVAEPVAAAAYFATVLGREIPVGRMLFVYDLGAGTFDVSLVRRTADGLAEIATDGLDNLGGLDLDAVVVGHARGMTGAPTDWERLDRPQSAGDRQARRLLWHGARAVKEQPSRHSTAELHLPLADAGLHLTRDEFERYAEPYLARTVDLTAAVLRGAGIRPTELAGVFLVGGSSRIPLAGTLLHRALGIAPVAIDQPELAVAEGCLHVPAPPTPASVTSVAAPQLPPLPPEYPTTIGPVPRNRRRRFVPAAAVIAALVVVPLGIRALGGSPSAPGSHASRAASAAHQGAVTPLKTLTHGGLVRAIAFDPADGNLLASAGDDGQVQLWDLRTGKSSVTLPADKNAVLRVAFSPDGRLLATVGQSGSVRLYNVASGQVLWQHSVDQQPLTVAFSPDGKTVATGHQTGLVELWNAVDGAGSPLRDTDQVSDGLPVIYLRFSPDGRWLARGQSGRKYVTIAALDNSGGVFASCRTCRTDTGAIAFTADSKTLVIGADDGSVGLWRRMDRTDQMTVVASLTGRTERADALAVESGSGLVAAAGGSSDPRVWLWRTRNLTASGTPEAAGSPVTLDGESKFVTDLAFSPDGKRIAAAGGDGKVLVYDVPTT